MRMALPWVWRQCVRPVKGKGLSFYTVFCLILLKPCPAFAASAVGPVVGTEVPQQRHLSETSEPTATSGTGSYRFADKAELQEAVDLWVSDEAVASDRFRPLFSPLQERKDIRGT